MVKQCSQSYTNNDDSIVLQYTREVVDKNNYPVYWYKEIIMIEVQYMGHNYYLHMSMEEYIALEGNTSIVFKDLKREAAYCGNSQHIMREHRRRLRGIVVEHLEILTAELDYLESKVNRLGASSFKNSLMDKRVEHIYSLI